MIKKYILFFIITGLIISIIGPANANTNSPSDLDLFNSIMKKHNLDFDKKKELLGDTYNCFSKDSDLV